MNLLVTAADMLKIEETSGSAVREKAAISILEKK